jgi:hypothetical protein
MEDRYREYRKDEDRDFTNRPGALDRRWGYNRPQEYRRALSDHEREYEEDYNAPAYWNYRKDWLEPGPYTGIGPKGYRRSDERILEDICDRLTQHAMIDASQIEVEVDDGEVTLKGTVQNRRMKRMVEANVDMISGVIDVHNRLRLEEREEKEKKFENPFPGGPVPTGSAGYEEENRS